jgi:peptidyl-prolyl cis-trans isomerase A (cyclophilin A)
MAIVRFECSCGDFDVQINEDWAPKGVARFMELVKEGFFGDLRFFRVVTQPRPFIVQFGIHGDPAVSSKWRNATIDDDPVKEGNSEGTLTFATSGPNSRTTQFFFNYADNSFLDSQGFSAIGKVMGEGMDVVRNICDEYGEAPDQGMAQSQGNTYFEAKFPNLDYIKQVTIVEE